MIRKLLLTAAAALITTMGLFAQQPLPVDKEVRKGVLDNGMTYYIRHNAKPENQAEFWIVHNVGAMQEEDSQQGLAHFLEHMAFNGTKNFPDKNLISWLESVGVKFGVNLNAMTGQESTIYNLSNVPVKREGVIDSALLILHDWSYYITLDGSEIDDERGVIIEERRQGSNAGRRKYDKSIQYIFGKDNKYAQRNVIGYEDGLRSFKHQELRDFYHRWYRTDMQSIIVVGDFDVDKMEQKIKTMMSSIPAVQNPEPKQVTAFPANKEPVIGIITDPELTSTNATIYFKREAIPTQFKGTDVAELLNIVDNLVMTIVDERMADITQKPDAPFLGGGMYIGNYVNAMDVTMAVAMARDGESAKAFEALYTELEKITRFGFTESEFERAKAEISRQIQQQYDSRNDVRSGQLVNKYVNNYVHNEAMMDAETEYEVDKAILGQINVDMLNEIAKGYLTKENVVVIIDGPEKEGVTMPTEADIMTIMTNVNSADIKANTDNVVIEPLISPKAKLKGSKVAKTETDKFGATVWTLKNGAKVVVKPTDFKADEVRISISAKGGKSILTNDELFSADIIPAYIEQAGVGKFDASSLRKQLSGKKASISTFVADYNNGMSGYASPKDLETMMQLMYLQFTQPRFDETDFKVLMDNYNAMYLNMASNPMFHLQKSMVETLYGNNPRKQVLEYDKLNQIDFNKMQQIYNKLYQNADDFTFTIIGNVDLAALKPMVEKYIGSLPKTKQNYTWVDDNARTVKGEVKNRFTTKMETPQSSVINIFTGEIPYTLENVLAIEVLSQILDIQYIATLREEKGGTYGVQTQGETSFAPVQAYSLFTFFNTDPQRVEELTKDIKNEIQKLAENGVKEEDLTKIKEYLTKQHPDQLKQNSYWLNTLVDYHVYGYDMDEGYMDIVNGFTSDYFKALAAKILADNNHVEIIMDPAK